MALSWSRDWINQLAADWQHYKLTVNLSMGKEDIKSLVLSRRRDFSDWNMSLCLENRA